MAVQNRSSCMFLWVLLLFLFVLGPGESGVLRSIVPPEAHTSNAALGLQDSVTSSSTPIQNRQFVFPGFSSRNDGSKSKTSKHRRRREHRRSSIHQLPLGQSMIGNELRHSRSVQIAPRVQNSQRFMINHFSWNLIMYDNGTLGSMRQMKIMPHGVFQFKQHNKHMLIEHTTSTGETLYICVNKTSKQRTMYTRKIETHVLARSIPKECLMTEVTHKNDYFSYCSHRKSRKGQKRLCIGIKENGDVVLTSSRKRIAHFGIIFLKGKVETELVHLVKTYAPTTTMAPVDKDLDKGSNVDSSPDRKKGSNKRRHKSKKKRRRKEKSKKKNEKDPGCKASLFNLRCTQTSSSEHRSSRRRIPPRTNFFHLLI